MKCIQIRSFFYLFLSYFLSDSNLALDLHSDSRETAPGQWLSSRKLFQKDRLECPAPNGIFMHARDCTKFINCANNYPHVQQCGAGTLFNPQYNICDWPQNTICFYKPQTTRATTEKIKQREIYFPTKTYGSLFPRSSPRSIITVRNEIPKTTVKNVISNYNNKKREIKKSPSLCLKPSGQFPYPKDCSKFVNCWNNRETLQSCAPGTLFDVSSLRCSWPHMAICGTKDIVKISPEIYKKKEIKVNSGQYVRLRGSDSPSVGYLQVNIDDEWLYVVHKGEDLGNTDLLCHAMGFKRGTRSSTTGLVYGRKTVLEQETNVMKCKELDDISNCYKINFDPKKHVQHVVGLRCKEDSASVCPSNWYSWKNNCIHLDSSQLLNRIESSLECKSIGGQLLTVEDQEKNNYISDLLIANGIRGGVHTSGIISQGKKINFKWTKKSYNQKSKFRNWWPDMSNTSFGGNNKKESRKRKHSCPTLRNVYSNDKDEFDVGYFFWNVESCYTPLYLVCQREPYDIGCIHGNGQDYSGSASISHTGMPCMFWKDVHPNLISSLDGSALRENYCANHDGDQRPWCYVESGLAEACDIPRCTTVKIDELESIPTCNDNQKRCRSGECIYMGQICDGTDNCIDGEDERYCPDYSSFFKSINSHAMEMYETEIWKSTPLDLCQRRCIQSKRFTCLSLSHEQRSQTCILSSFLAFKSGGLVSKHGWEYHFREGLEVNCSNSFRCHDFKCISSEQVCDGKLDCTGSEDERECYFQESFEIRLSNGAGSYEGNVEIKLGTTWGNICHDFWDLQDANVVCRQLGFEKGAKNFHTDSRFDNSVGEYLMDDVNCVGSEKSLIECRFSGWMEHDCGDGEAAGVTCYQDHETCSEDKFYCDNGLCIPLSYYCDNIDDCGDNSDEINDFCNSPPTLRLVREKRDLLKSVEERKSDDLEVAGRVELRYKGVWGTICDDDIGLNEGHVICRMLGWEKAESVHKNSSFGAGHGPIWVDELACLGSENDIMECYHKNPLGGSACDHTEDLGVHCSNNAIGIPPGGIGDNEGKNLIEDVLPNECGITFVPNNPKSELASPKVVHGIKPTAGSHPWMAGIRKKTTTESVHWCGAFIITNRILLTAAHCLESYPKSRYLVRTGDFHNTMSDAYEEEWELDEILSHPTFDKRIRFNNDIALIWIKPKNGKFIRFNEKVQPICLPSETWKYEAGTNCTVAGWGSSGSAGYSHVLLSTVLPIISDSKCKDDLVYGLEDITDAMFCAGYLEGGADTCQGDSGGPLICNIEGVNTAVGIISWGHGCGRANKPGVYTKLTKFLQWIQSNL